MKVAIISDIHGNMQALDAVMTDIKNENCEKIFCLGDIAMAGPEPEKTVKFIQDMIKNNDNFSIIQGNTDKILANFSEELYEKFKQNIPIMANAAKNDVQILSDETKSFLNNLAVQKELEIEGVKILLVHGSPRKNDENITPDLTVEKIEEMLEGVDANLIFCGHTHVPCGYQTSTKQTVVNVGSVGRPFTPRPQACYVVAEFEKGAFNILHKFVNYDNQKASEILSQRQFEGADKLAEILIKPEKRHI